MDILLAEQGARVARTAAGPAAEAIRKKLLFGLLPPFIVVNVIIIVIVALIFYWLIRSSRKSHDVMDILKERYAKGEIDKETFHDMKQDLVD